MTHLAPGDSAPTFHQRTRATPRFAFDTAAGRYLVLCFLGTGNGEHGQKAIAAVRSREDLFDDHHLSFFGITNDPSDEREDRLVDHYPGYRYFWDFDLTIAKKYGVTAPDADPEAAGGIRISRSWVILDPSLRVLHVVPFRPDAGDIDDVMAILPTLPEVNLYRGVNLPAPVLYLPNVLEDEICDQLVGLYEADGGEESGFMRDVGGKTVGIIDASHKRRADYTIDNQPLIDRLQNRVKRKIIPQIAKVHQFHVTRMERYIVACYDSAVGGHFRPHRDNTTKGTAHRRFAVSINLNDEFEGGELQFPEYGDTRFKPPRGAAVIFSCSLLHMVSPVTAGRRYAFLPFLYDDAAAKLREENSRHLADAEKAYRDEQGKKSES